MTDQEAETLIKAAAKALMKQVADLLYDDPHSWSTRPCPTCRPISALLGEPFGCYRYAIEKQQKAQGQGVNIKGQRSAFWGQKPTRIAVGITGWSLIFMLAGCATPPVPKHDAAVDQAWARFLLRELPPEQRPKQCDAKGD